MKCQRISSFFNSNKVHRSTNLEIEVRVKEATGHHHKRLQRHPEPASRVKRKTPKKEVLNPSKHQRRQYSRAAMMSSIFLTVDSLLTYQMKITGPGQK